MRPFTGAAAVALVLLAFAATTESALPPIPYALPKEVLRYRVTIEAGENWSHPLSLGGTMNMILGPQLVLWAGDADHRYLDTFFITRRTAGDEWRPDPRHQIGPIDPFSHPEALPVWLHHGAQAVGDSASAALDAVTQATPPGDLTVDVVMPRRDKPFYLMLEVNVSEDFNASYPQTGRLGGPVQNGQPSLVYAVKIDPALTAAGWEMDFVGAGSPDGADGSVATTLDGITTARDIIRRVTVTAHGKDAGNDE